MSRTRLFLYSLPLVALLAACSGGGTPSALPPDQNVNSAPAGPGDQPALPPDSQATSQPSAAPESDITTESTTLASVPAHIQTWAKDLYWSSGAAGTAAEARTYLTYAQGGLGNSKARSDCSGAGGCKSVFYFDPHMFYDTSVCGTMSPDVRALKSRAAESWFVHETGYADYAHRLRGHYTQTCNGRTVSVPVYAMNTLNAGAKAYYHNYLATNAAGYDDFFMDDTSGQALTQFYGAGGGFCPNNAPNHYCYSTQEMRNDAAVVSEHGALANALPIPGFYNGLNFANQRPNDLGVLSSSSHFVGAICEDCVVSSGVFRPSMYASVLNAMAEIDHTNGAMVELNHGVSPVGSAAQIAQRTITTAMAWLGYSEGHVIVYPDLEANTQHLAIFPENSIYPTSPIETMTNGATDIQVAPGVYRREFRACYYNRSPIGQCAAIVNANSHAVTVSSAWLHQAYGHTVGLIGGDIPSGGRVSLTGAFYVNRTSIAASQSIMIVR